MRIERRVRHTRAVDRRKVIRLEEDMGLARILRSARTGAGSGRAPAHSPGANRASGATIRVNSPVTSSTPTTTRSAPETPAIQA